MSVSFGGGYAGALSGFQGIRIIILHVMIVHDTVIINRTATSIG